MGESEPLNDLSVAALIVHPVKGVLLAPIAERQFGSSCLADIPPGENWSDVMHHELLAKYGNFSFEVLCLARMETLHLEQLWEEPRFVLFVVCEAKEAIEPSEDAFWTHKEEEITQDLFCHHSFHDVATYALRKHYPKQMQFSL